MTSEAKPKAAVIGIGNLLFKDEGIGVHAIRALEALELPDCIDLELIDAGTSPNLAAILDDAIDKLVIIDAVKAGGKPGEIYRIKTEDLTFEESKEISIHELGLRQNLKMMELAGKKPEEVIIIGVEPEEIGWGTDLSPLIERKMPRIIKMILKEIGIKHKD
jgi:hydrogenase maturation protease